MIFNLQFDLFAVGFVSAAMVILGFTIYFNNRKSTTNILFLIFTLVSAFWSVSNYLSYQIDTELFSLWLVRIVMFLACYQTFFFYSLMYAFPKEKIVFPNWYKKILIPSVIIVSILTLTPLVFSSVKIIPGSSPEPIPAPGIIVFALLAVTQVISGIVLIVRRTIKSIEVEKKQFRLISTGVALMFLFILIFNFIFVAVLGNSNFIPFSSLFILPFVFFTFYAITRHELLKTKIIGVEILTFFVITLTFVEVILSRSLTEVIFRVVIFMSLLVLGISLIRSVIKEVKQREKLQELTNKLKALDKQKDEFISMAAHELRAPMTAIKGYVSMIMEGDTGEIPEKTRGFLLDVNAVNDRLVRLVNNMLNVSRIEEGRLIYNTGVVRLSDVAHTVYISFRFEAERKGLKFEVNYDKNINDYVEVDPDRLNEVIGNFVSNAVKYTESGKIAVNITSPKKGIVRLGVKDTGPGISESERKKLFQKFYRVESTAGKTIGTGLGLYISKLLVDKFNGKIGLNSKVGEGSEFWIELPVTGKKPEDKNNTEMLQKEVPIAQTENKQNIEENSQK